MHTSLSDKALLVEDFRESLGSATSVNMLPVDLAREIRKGQFYDARAPHLLSEPGLHLAAEYGDSPLKAGDAILDFRHLPGLEEGKEDSANRVFVGELTILDEASHITPVTVAVKRRFSMHNLALHEFGVHQFINNTGLINSFRPLGFLTTKERQSPSTYLLTLLEPDILSFDNFDWRVSELNICSGEGLDVRSQKRLHNLGLAALYLGSMHALGIVHGNAEAKNVAYSTRDGSIMVADLETATVLRDEETWDTTEFNVVKLFGKDLADFVRSIAKVGFLSRADPETRREVINKHFLDIYFSKLRHPTSKLYEGEWEPQEIAAKLSNFMCTNVLI